MTDEELGAAISSLELEWPGTPDVAPDVVATLRALERDPRLPRPRPPRTWSRRRRLVLLIAASLLLLGAVGAIAKFAIDLGAVVVRERPGSPVTLPSQTLAPSDLGRPVSLERAGQIAGFDPIVPAALGTPDVVWAFEDVTSFEPTERSTVIAMAWRPREGLPRISEGRWGAVLFEFRGEVNVATKLVSEGEDVRALAPFAFGITAPHELSLLTPDGLRRFRVDGTVVLWQELDVVLRLEAALPLERTARIAGV
jgi:hypothetical protein